MAPADPLAYFSEADANGVSVRSHLTEVIHKLLLSKDKDALAKLESISLDVKAAHFNAQKPAKGVPALPAGSILTTGTRTQSVVPTESWLKRAKALQSNTDPEVTPPQFFSELPDQMPMFSWAGVGMSKEETYRTYLAMTALQDAKGFYTVRFFGKIYGTKAEYVILECRGPAETHVAPSAVGATPPEAPGVGLNTCTYFVAPSAAEEFTQLEDVTPEAVLISSQIRKYLTGELSAPVACYPAFPGPESAYLRAQIARIAQATVLQPTGRIMFADTEEEVTPKPIVPNPDYTVPDTLPATDSWIHSYGGILKIGRCTNVPKPPSEEEEEAAEELEEEKEPLGSIAEDGPVATFDEAGEETLPAWSTAMYNNVYPSYAVAIAKSNRWPGAYAAIAKNGDKAACVYFGSGHECAGKPFTPAAPPPVLVESAETEEADEVELAAENALLKEIDEAKLAAANADEPGEE